MTEIETMVRLKYQLITTDNYSNRELLVTYPAEVCNNWAWRCAEDVAPLADVHFEAVDICDAIRSYRYGSLSQRQVTEIFISFRQVYTGSRAVEAAVYAMYNAMYRRHDLAIRNCIAANWCRSDDGRLPLYIDWLIEELANWEMKNG